MENNKKSRALAAVAGVVVGAGAVIASVIALKDRKNRQKVKDLVASAKDLVTGYQKDASDQVEDTKENINKMASKAIDKAEKVTKSAKKEVRNL